MPETTFDERTVFVHLVFRHGMVRTRPARIVAPVGPDGDCWTYAWNYAQEHGYRYVEGSVQMDDRHPREFIRAHAWCEEDSPTGVVVHEVTEGYEDVTEYRGITVDCSPGGPIADFTRPWDTVRGSVIEALIVNGLSIGGILLAVALPEETP
jgi:hypothetical protein